ncbi:MAG: hypothetical protein E3J66_01440 [Dehalococcoidia bacterium]|nr:MAG: hypothetical protein E3J66_01440 [Dehalococcoidia bacterium]
MKVLNEGLKTAYQVAAELSWKLELGGVAFSDLGSWDRRLAVLETIAHLKLLTSAGNVGKIDQEGFSLYLSKD